MLPEKLDVICAIASPLFASLRSIDQEIDVTNTNLRHSIRAYVFKHMHTHIVLHIGKVPEGRRSRGGGENIRRVVDECS